MVAIKDPSGFTHARINRKKIAICNQPFVVMVISKDLELLRLQERIQQIHAERQRNQSRNQVVHNFPFSVGAKTTAAHTPGPSSRPVRRRRRSEDNSRYQAFLAS